MNLGRVTGLFVFMIGYEKLSHSSMIMHSLRYTHIPSGCRPHHRRCVLSPWLAVVAVLFRPWSGQRRVGFR